MTNFTQETATAVLGGIELRAFPDGQRRPLNVDNGLVLSPTDEPAKFNAVGSQTNYPSGSHLPILDVCGRVELQNNRVSGSKAILDRKVSDPYDAIPADTYTPQSVLRDVLGDYDIEAEIASSPSFAIALRSSKKGTFETFLSSKDGHHHLYIQSEFSDADYHTLLFEFSRFKVISRAWYDLAKEAGMGVVRAPWSAGQPLTAHEVSLDLGD